MYKKVIGGVFGAISLLSFGMANAATVSLTPSASTINTGGTFTLTVVGGAFDTLVSSGAVTLTWDPTVLSLSSTRAAVFQSGNVNGFTDPLYYDNLTAGKLVVALGTGLFGAPVGPNFDFFSLDFTALPATSTQTSAITLASGGALGNWQDGVTPAQDITNVIYNSAAIQVNAVPIPAAVWLLGSGLLGLVGVARRRSSGAATVPVAA